ncbi:MAG: MFS transporter [Alphaproteobacteria bacterium]|nr:MFS transporter [Alphaproteobacteria bacterium]
MSIASPSPTPHHAPVHGLPWGIVRAFSVTMIAHWGALYYGISILLVPIEREMGWSRDAILGAYSMALGISALCAPYVGAHIDRHGGRGVMVAGSLLAGLLLAAMAEAQSLWAFYAIWAGLGVAMSLTLYEPAFAVITHTFGSDARRAITILTFAGGLASTVSWPLTQALEGWIGWRGAVRVHAAIALFVCAPLVWQALKVERLHRAAKAGAPAQRVAAAPAVPPADGQGGGLRAALRQGSFWALALSLVAYGFAVSLLAAHLVPLLAERGMSDAAAVAIGSMVGPMQVAGRILEFAIARRVPITTVAAVNAWALPVALAMLQVSAVPGWGWLIFGFVVIYGAGNGIVTIVRGALPAELFGRQGYGAIAGSLTAPANIARAAGAWLGALAWQAAGGYGPVIWGLVAGAALGALAMGLAVRLGRGRRQS